MKSSLGAAVFVLLVCAAAAAAAVFYCCWKSSRRHTVTVSERDVIILEPNRTVKKDDDIQWMFGEKEWQILIAELRGEDGKIYDGVAHGRFRGRLDLDKKTGSLSIKNISAAHSGLYTLKIRSSSGGSSRQEMFTVTVDERVENIPVKDGESIFLNPDPETSRADLMLWMFGPQDDLIALIRRGTVQMYDAAGQIFRGRQQVEGTGSLTITDITSDHTGPYKLQTISRDGGILFKKFRVITPDSDHISLDLNTVNEPPQTETIPLNTHPAHLPLSLDLNTANKLLLSENDTLITNTGEVQPYPDHPDRFDDVYQVLCRQSVTGHCHWELEWSGGYVEIAVSYKSISRKGQGQCRLGCNAQSWSLICSPHSYSFRHNNTQSTLSLKPISLDERGSLDCFRKIRVSVNHSAGTLSFCSGTETFYHTVQTTFTEPLYPGFLLGFGSSVKLNVD